VASKLEKHQLSRLVHAPDSPAEASGDYHPNRTDGLILSDDVESED
jgi:hypothetical protein